MIEYQLHKHFHCEYQWQKHFNDGRKLSCTHVLNLQSSCRGLWSVDWRSACKLKQVLELITSWSGRACPRDEDNNHGELARESLSWTQAEEAAGSWPSESVERSSPPHLHGDPTLRQGADGGDDGWGGRWGDGWRGTAAGELDLSSAPRGPASSPGATACYWSGRGRPAGARDQLRRASPGPASKPSSDALRRASPALAVHLFWK
jgi:hypothetical protein